MHFKSVEIYFNYFDGFKSTKNGTKHILIQWNAFFTETSNFVHFFTFSLFSSLVLNVWIPVIRTCLDDKTSEDLAYSCAYITINNIYI